MRAEKLLESLARGVELPLTPLLSQASMEAFSFSRFLRKAATLTRSSGDWRYSPIACAAETWETIITMVYRTRRHGDFGDVQTVVVLVASELRL